MSPAPVTILINPPQIISINQFRKLCTINPKIPFCSRSLKTSEFRYRKSVITMAAESIDSGIISSGDSEHITLAFEHQTLIHNHNHQTVGGRHVIFNKLSKWVVAVADSFF